MHPLSMTGHRYYWNGYLSVACHEFLPDERHRFWWSNVSPRSYKKGLLRNDEEMWVPFNYWVVR